MERRWSIHAVHTKTPEAEGMWYQISFKSAGSQDFLFFSPQDFLKQNFEPGLKVSRKMGQQNESECRELRLHSSVARAVGMGSPGQWYRGAPVRGPLLHIPWLACPSAREAACRWPASTFCVSGLGRFLHGQHGSCRSLCR